MLRRASDACVDRLLESLDPFLRSLHLVQVVGQHRLMGGVAHLLPVEPRHVLGSPRCDLLRPAKIELKQEFSEPISMTKLVSLGGMARSNQISQGLLLGVGNPDRREVATS